MKIIQKPKEFLADLDLIIEGIDIDDRNKIVKVNLDHENGVDTSTILNPIYSSIDNHTIISIFKRKHNKQNSGDGNPLLYALKNLFGWKIATSDIIKLLKQFIRISEKIKPKYDTIITIPSRSDLNNQILYRLNKIIKADVEITSLFSKLETSEVYDICIYGNVNIPDDAYDSIVGSESKMGKYFSFKHIDPRFRHHITKMWDTTYIDMEFDYANDINGKDILILDDTIASGQTISLFCEAVLELYDPKSITIITLFSKI